MAIIECLRSIIPEGSDGLPHSLVFFNQTHKGNSSL